MSATTNARRRLGLAAALITSAIATQSAFGVLSITNGNFETYEPGQTAGGNYPGVYQWFNAQNATAPWYYNVSQATAVSPTSTASLVLTGNHDATNGVPLPWIYQSIGFNTESKATLPIQFDLGGFTDNNPISAHIDVSLFKATGFTGADNTDILGASGVMQVGNTFSVERLNFAGNSGVINVAADFDLTGVTATDELFLRFQSTVPTDWTGSNYVRLDNIKIRPDVVYTPVDLTYAGAAAGGTWDDNTTAAFTYNGSPRTFQEGDRPTFDDAGAVDGNGVSTVNIVGSPTSGNITVNSSHDYVFTGGTVTAASATTTLTKSGTGKLTINNNAINAPGGVTINAGTVEFNHAFTGGGAWQMPVGDGPLVNNGTIIINHTYTSTTDINEWAPLTLNNAISGSGNIIIRNHAFLGAAGNQDVVSTFTGTITLEGGFTYVGNLTGLGSPAGGTTVMSGATLAVVDEWHLGPNATLAEPLTLNGFGATTWFNGGNPSGALFQWEGTRTFTGPINLASTSSVIVRQDPATAATNPSTMIWTGPLTAAPGAGLQKEGDGTLVYTGATLDSLTVYGGKMQQTAGTTKVKTLYLEAGTTMDLTGSSLVVDYDGTASAYADLDAKRQAGQIFTSLDLTKYTIGIMDNALNATPVGSIGGTPIDASSAVIRGTLKGDSDLDGSVNFADLLTLAKNYNGTGKLYQQGDTDYSGTVDFTDLLALAKNYNGSVTAAQAAGLSSEFLGDLALAQSMVPEPMSASLLAAAGLVLVRRRR